MNSNVPASSPQADATAWHEIEDLVDELAQLARTSIPPGRFYHQLLDRAVAALAALGGAVWLEKDGRLELQSEIQLGDLFATVDPDRQKQHHQLLQKLRLAEEPQAVPAESSLDDDSGSSSSSTAANPTAALLLLCPLTDGDQRYGVLEIFQRPTVSRAACHGSLRFLSTLAELATEFHRNLQLTELRDRSTYWSRYQKFAESVHQQLDLEQVAACTASDGRQLIGSDRLSVVVRHRSSKYRVRAVSGVASVDRRSASIRQLEKLVGAVAAISEPLWFDGTRDRLPPQIARPLENYLDRSHIRMLGIVPLHPPEPAKTAERPVDHAPPARPQFLLVIERFDTEVPLATLQQRTELVARQSEPALRNAWTYQKLPLLWLNLLAGRFVDLFRLRQLPKTILIPGLLAAVLLALVLVPGDFQIEGTGALQPEIRQHVFAATDGEVSRIAIDHSREVQAGDLLIELRNDELEYEYSRVLGDLQTSSRRLSTIQASRLNSSPNTPEAIEEYNRLTAEEEELKEQIRSLTSQQEILTRRRSALSLRSPLDGRVLTWDVEQLLESRPVQRGQRLLTVADLDGPWIIEMYVPDDHIRHVIDAWQAAGEEELPVSFLVATDPGTTCTGTVESIALTTEETEDHQPAVLVTVRVDPEKVPGLRPGATVIPQVQCGQRPIGYVWFHDLWDAIRTRLLF